MVPCLDLRQRVTHSEIHLLINIDAPNMTCQIGDEYKLLLIIQWITEQHKFAVVYLTSFVVINCRTPDVSCQSNTLKSSVMNSLPATGSVPVLQWGLLNSFFSYCIFCLLNVPAAVMLNLPSNGSSIGLRFLPGGVWSWFVGSFFFIRLQNFATAELPCGLEPFGDIIYWNVYSGRVAAVVQVLFSRHMCMLEMILNLINCLCSSTYSSVTS